jgi:3-methyladenine DNA glycosylase AlkD
LTEMTQFTCQSILSLLRDEADPDNVYGMARFGINTSSALGIKVTRLRELARDVKQEIKDRPERHALAAELWNTGVHEARILASIIDEPSLVTEAQMEAWAAEFDSWDVVDGCAGNLFDKTPFAIPKALEWSAREEEYVRRAGFALMAWIAAHNKRLPDSDFEPFLEAILARATDDHNFVKKAVNWALRGIGKRNGRLRQRAIATSRQMLEIPSKPARWIARDALRELENYPDKA